MVEFEPGTLMTPKFPVEEEDAAPDTGTKCGEEAVVPETCVAPDAAKADGVS